MRVMKKIDGGFELNIVEHIITKNLWEYYVTDQVHSDDKNIILCYVLGFEDELGDVDMRELKPFVSIRSSNLKNIFPANGWEWKEK